MTILLYACNMARGQWTSRPSFRDVLDYCAYGDGTLCVCRNGVFVVDADGEMIAVTRSSGLSSAYVSAGGASASSFAVGYENGSMDVFYRGALRRHISDVALGNSLSGSAVRNITYSNDIIVVSGDFGVSLVDADRAEVLSACRFDFPVINSFVADGRIYARTSFGVSSVPIDSYNLGDPQQWRQEQPDVALLSGPEKVRYNGPRPNSLPSDDVYAMASADGTVAIASRFYAEVSRNGIFAVENPDGVDFTAVFHNPYNPSHVFLGAADGTLFEYLDYRLKARYDGRISGRVVGMDCTPEGDLLILSADACNPVVMFDHNGNWHSVSSFQSMNCASPLQLLRISDYVFAVNMGRSGIYMVDLSGTPMDFADDRHTSFYPMQGSTRIGTLVSCMAVDGGGRLIIGTDKGVAYCSQPMGLLSGDAAWVRPIAMEALGGNDTYAQYLLSQKYVSSMAVDAGGRLWIATLGAGVFLVSADINEQISHFTEQNSPLPSDTVSIVNIVDRTGEVFFATRNGVASYLSDVQAPSDDLSDVEVYPNPVRPDYDGDICVSGLEDGCDVRITDVSGRLVYRCESVGGRVQWDGLNRQGHRCATGVYLVFVINVNTGHKIVKKLLFVR